MLPIMQYISMVLLVLLLCSHREVWCCLCCNICMVLPCVAIGKYGVVRIAVHKYDIACVESVVLPM